MHEIPRSLDRRALRLATLTLCSLALFTACDTDEPMAPKRTEVPTEAQPIVSPLKSGVLILKAVDQNSQLIATSLAEYKIVFPNQTTTWIVQDNSAKDNDPTTGIVQFKGMAPGWYTVCVTVPPVDYGPPDPACVPVYVGAGMTAGKWFFFPPIARATWTVQDFVPNYVGGMVFTLKDSADVTISTFTDNSAPDIDPAAGKIEVKFPVAGMYTVCETALPPGYVFPPAQWKFCFSFQVTHGKVTQVAAFTVYPANSAYWQVTDGTIDANFFYNLIGPSTFHVVNALGAGAFDVVDNGVNDIDGTLGKIAVKLPVAGYWSICETVPPPNHWNAQPSCKRIEVTTGVPAWAEWFINPEMQVYSPGPTP